MATSNAAKALTRRVSSVSKAADARPHHSFIVSPVYDLVFFLLPPVVGLILYRTWLPVRTTPDGSIEVLTRWTGTMAVWIFHNMLTQAHVFLVLTRSHLNPDVFRRHRFRFLVAPLLMLFVTFTTDLGFACFVSLAFFYDIYHSAMQTFGLGRLYDAKAGFPPSMGRQWDIWLNHFLYTGPFIGGFNLFYFLNGLAPLDPHIAFLAPMVRAVMASRTAIAQAAFVGGTLFAIAYAIRVALWWKQGHRVSKIKLALVLTTGLVTIYSWGFLPFPVAQCVVNFYHAVQYFALVWWTERSPLTKNFKLNRFAKGPWLAFLVMSLPCLVYAGFWAKFDGTSFVRLSVVVSILHFWYDGFIWSVRRGEVHA